MTNKTIFDDPFQYKLIAKKYANLMLDLYKKGKTKEQISRIIANREEAPSHNEEPATFQPGERVVLLSGGTNGNKISCYQGIVVEECPEYNDGHRRYVVRIAFYDNVKNDGSIFYKDMVTVWWHICRVE